MPSVSVTINGKNYRMACDEGQEAHLEMLAEKLDSYVSGLKGTFGDIGDQRLVVMAGIMVTDEMMELSKRIEKLEASLADAKSQTDLQSRHRQDDDDALARALTQAAEKIEAINRKLSDN